MGCGTTRLERWTVGLRAYSVCFHANPGHGQKASRIAQGGWSSKPSTPNASQARKEGSSKQESEFRGPAREGVEDAPTSILK